MSEAPSTLSFPDLHVAWLACLYAIASKVRRQGLLSIECDVECPDHADSLFAVFPQTQAQPYLDFAADVLRLMVGGNLNADEMKVYAEHYIAGLTAADGVEESVLRTIWLTLWAMMAGYAPQIACEFGRQGIPHHGKPRFTELEDLLKQTRLALAQRDAPKREGGLEAAAERFVASLGGG